ncbi:hypothetical protein [Crateriforma conspicua]|uniref:Uncharacterized protein n=1 Tax=Crateriforma conspicua TaxID=2527996 RepID=A0A5C5XR20_9PLAN|nr:hypothetical protein [Crateriforma conspicua]TWT65666.1 hypothetical protein Pan14r_52150 [Crateriforma conspicua]
MKRWAWGTLLAFFALGQCQLGAREVPAENYFRTTDQDVNIQPRAGDVVVFDEARNSQYFLNGRNLNIVAATIKVIGNARISSFQSEATGSNGQGSDGSHAADYGDSPHCRNGSNGRSGGQGGDGPEGNSGASGPAIYLHIGTITGRGLLHIDAKGQKGGKGGLGGTGGRGGRGARGGDSESNIFDCACGGGDGGDGGSGGQGGRGGRGGVGGSGGIISLTQNTVRVEQRLSLNVDGGPGGNGGTGGTGGPGGEAGGMGRGSRNCGGGRTGSGGPSGSTGPTGSAGRRGEGGDIVRLPVDIPFPEMITDRPLGGGDPVVFSAPEAPPVARISRTVDSSTSASGFGNDSSDYTDYSEDYGHYAPSPDHATDGGESLDSGSASMNLEEARELEATLVRIRDLLNEIRDLRGSALK